MGSVESEKYCLKWNDFTSNLSVAFQEMRRDADFFDLTLLTENSEIRCHKLVLGACSSHFRQIIKRLSSQNIPNPAIYLRGVRHEDIKNLLEFMYLGEVNIAHEDLDSFLAVAQDLCIKGLTQDNSTSQNDTSQHTPSGSGNTSSASKRPKFSKNGVEHQQVKKPKREQIMQPIQPKQEPVTHHEIDMSESVGIENVEADVETYDEYYDEDANMDNTGEDSKGFVHVDLPEDLEASATGFNEILDDTPKKTRKSYTYQEKADIIQKYLDAKQLNEDLSLKAFAEANNIAKSMIYNWLKDKEVIFQKCYESYDTMKNMGCRIKKE